MVQKLCKLHRELFFFIQLDFFQFKIVNLNSKIISCQDHHIFSITKFYYFVVVSSKKCEASSKIFIIYLFILLFFR